MKAILAVLVLALILSTCVLSAVLYLQNDYVSSAALTIIWFASMTLWIKSNGLMDEKEGSLSK